MAESIRCPALNEPGQLECSLELLADVPDYLETFVTTAHAKVRNSVVKKLLSPNEFKII